MFGIELNPEGLIAFFSEYAYRPELVYCFVIGFMLASAFGMPIPEEVVLISSGIVAYMAHHPEQFPPPYPGAQSVNVYVLMAVCFFAVLAADTLIYSIGKFLGKRLVRFPWMRKRMEGKNYATVQKWFDRYGNWCVAIFRFTPGVRFPGHIFCGVIGVPLYKFIAIDALVALISVPTQVWLAATYGEIIIAKLKEFKLAFLVLFALLFIGWLIKKRMDLRASRAHS